MADFAQRERMSGSYRARAERNDHYDFFINSRSFCNVLDC